ncbi:S66 family peptidase [Candidatus Halobonum tyrrellensis]|uniref:LD-carboxypeptidase n=1 Tax=Candidatus Halobonum tyrrellensis G22 TaxID=1324957 RepID=V4HBC9_9EURY|nr:S66 peptidase family protein [Candidatus Halobonum tyrrellensis]ESP87338.1 LD-carboxypeptidase [Candidatus Halobonum tyrrellensis G22]
MVDADYPPALGAGDTVAIVAPSHAPPDGAIARGIDRLDSFGLDARVFDSARRDTDWLRDHPDERAADVHRAFEADDVDGVVAAMGGNRELQLVDSLDPEVVSDDPKRFYGSSDNTHLHQFLNAAGLVSFYGGQLFPDLVADPEMHPYTREYVGRAFGSTPFGAVTAAEEWTDEYYDLEADDDREWFPADGWTWHRPEAAEGSVAGRVVGGCLSMLGAQLMLGASSYFPDVLDPGDVLAVETSGETPEPAVVERFFVALGERGVLDRLGALLVGRPETPVGSTQARARYRRDQRETVASVVDEYADTPVVFDLDFGHTAPVLPLPLGAPVEVDADERAIRFPDAEADASAEPGSGPDSDAGAD